ncbi:MAG: hypothetical protein ACI841_001917 [Planctomycetota bacterium]|jgi:hypothetical protein
MQIRSTPSPGSARALLLTTAALTALPNTSCKIGGGNDEPEETTYEMPAGSDTDAHYLAGTDPDEQNRLLGELWARLTVLGCWDSSFNDSHLG